MRTTLNIDEPMLRRAADLTGIRGKTALIRLGLEALVARESGRRLAMLGGTEKGLRPPRRHRPARWQMVLVDTSVWVAHLRSGNAALAAMLTKAEVACHPLIIAELACGNLRQRQLILRLLRQLPRVTIAADDEILEFVEAQRLMGRGIGIVDVHLLAASRLSQLPLWTIDRRLAAVAASLGLGYGRWSVAVPVPWSLPKVELVAPGTLSVGEGKAKRVVDNRTLWSDRPLVKQQRNASGTLPNGNRALAIAAQAVSNAPS
jgi:predicted nucleic acid-binding protein